VEGALYKLEFRYIQRRLSELRRLIVEAYRRGDNEMHLRLHAEQDQLMKKLHDL
jgi:hypothetical protein